MIFLMHTTIASIRNDQVSACAAMRMRMCILSR